MIFIPTHKGLRAIRWYCARVEGVCTERGVVLMCSLADPTLPDFAKQFHVARSVAAMHNATGCSGFLQENLMEYRARLRYDAGITPSAHRIYSEDAARARLALAWLKRRFGYLLDPPAT
jgi:hypothetical protein